MPKLSGKQKIHRYGQLYPSRRSTPGIVLRTTLSVILLLALGFVGWNAYGPVSDYFSGKLAAIHRAEKEKPKEETSSETVSGTAVPETSEPEPSQTPAILNSIYLPPNMISDEETLRELLPRLKEAQINGIMFDLKDSSGMIHYQSAQEKVLSIQAQLPEAIDLARLCKILKENEFISIGRFSVFADPLAASRIDDAGVKYMNTKMLWLDNSPENGGKAWLNPYSSTAQDYLISLLSEAAEYGVQQFVFDHYGFPTGLGMEFASYGETANEKDQATILTETLTALRLAAEKKDTDVYFYVSGQAALGQTNQFYGGVNPLTFHEQIVLGVLPAQFGDGYAIEGFSLEEPIRQPYETVKSLLAHLSTDLSGKHIIAMVQGYTATGNLANNKVYDMQDIQAQLQALKDASINDFVIYSSDGSYPTKSR